MIVRLYCVKGYSHNSRCRCRKMPRIMASAWSKPRDHSTRHQTQNTRQKRHDRRTQSTERRTPNYDPGGPGGAGTHAPGGRKAHAARTRRRGWVLPLHDLEGGKLPRGRWDGRRPDHHHRDANRRGGRGTALPIARREDPAHGAPAGRPFAEAMTAQGPPIENPDRT